MDSCDERSARAYPVLTLPPEIVSEIFVSFLPSYPEPPPKTGLLSPFLLCQICRQWRAIAASTPDLWRAIAFDLFSASKTFSTAQLERAETWLARSGMRPLSIRLICTPGVYINPSLTILFNKLLALSQRWEYLHLAVPFDFFALVNGNMPFLRALTIRVYENLPVSNTVRAFPRAPALRSVLLRQSFPRALPLPWAQITRLESRSLYTSECLSILDAMPQLSYCQFEVYVADPLVPQLPATITHAQLRHFVLDAPHNGINLQVFEPSISMDALKAFVSRSNCKIDLLLVTKSSLWQSIYYEVFPSIPTITLV
ncbi:hypothetical protein C8R46DRAFT_1057069 [Mycena filopes]|nr:hypothetical protein C8R46DRAFT_1057069 [Mycena filopes]